MPISDNPHDDDFLLRREADILIAQTATAAALALEVHRREHISEEKALDRALHAVHEQDREHRLAHTAAHDSHEEKHKSEGQSVVTALEAVARERRIHAEAHEREHTGHLEIHKLNNLAIEKAEGANDKRFNAANGYREAYESRVNSAASKEALDGLRKEMDRRLITLETNDAKAEGKGLGQSALTAYVVAGLSIIGSLIVVVNLLTTR